MSHDLPEGRGGAPQGTLQVFAQVGRRRVIDNSYSFLFGPVVAMLALGVIVLLCRWVFSTGHRDDRVARRAKAVSAGDFGLLVPVATVRTSEDADLLRGVLRDAGIRGTLGAAPEGGLTVLVFRADALRARDLVNS